MNGILPARFGNTSTQLLSKTPHSLSKYNQPTSQQDAVLFGLSKGRQGLGLGLAATLLALTTGCGGDDTPKQEALQNDFSALATDNTEPVEPVSTEVVPSEEVLPSEEPSATVTVPVSPAPAPTTTDGSNPFAPAPTVAPETPIVPPVPSATVTPEPPVVTETPPSPVATETVPVVTETPVPTPAPTEVPPPPPPPPPPVEHVNLLAQNLWGIYHPGAMTNWQGRMDEVVKIVREYNVDLMTTSEGERLQINYLKDKLKDDFESFPGHYVGGRSKPSERTIFFKVKDEKGNPLWQKKAGSNIKIPNYPDTTVKNPTRGMPWVHLVHAQTGQEIVLLSLHAVAWNKTPGTDPGGALKREESGHIIAAWANQMKKDFPNAVVIAAGDINQPDFIRAPQPAENDYNDVALNGDRSRIIPCIVGKELRAIDDIAAGREGACPQNGDKKYLIDMAFTNAQAVGTIQYIDRKQSDHHGLFTRIKLFGV